MRQRQPGRIRLSLWVLVLAPVLAVACGGAGAQQEPPAVALPTPLASWSPEVEGTVAQLRAALAGVGKQLYPPLQPYRPSEPASLTQLPRAVLQVSGPDPDEGFVIVYDLPDDADATAAGAELAGYLGSGFGQTNFPLDAQFSVAQVGGTIVFTWWSGDRSSDPAGAEGAFDAIRSVGVAIPVLK